MPTAQEWLAIVERLRAVEVRQDMQDAEMKAQGSWIRWAVLILATFVAPFAGAWVEHALRH